MRLSTSHPSQCFSLPPSPYKEEIWGAETLKNLSHLSKQPWHSLLMRNGLKFSCLYLWITSPRLNNSAFSSSSLWTPQKLLLPIHSTCSIICKICTPFSLPWHIPKLNLRHEVRHHYTPIRMAEIKNDNTKCWRGCRDWALIHCWWVCKIVWLLWKISLGIPQKIKHMTQQFYSSAFTQEKWQHMSIPRLVP